MLPRCGRAAHICGANYFCNLFFLLQLHFLKLSNSQLNCLYETSCKFGQGNGAIAARWQAKAGVELPFAGRERLFSLGAIFMAFHVKHFAACRQRSGLLALNLASIFEKLLDQKTFCFCAPHKWPNLFFILQIPCTFESLRWQFLHCFMWNIALGKPIACGSAESLRCLPLCCSPGVALSELVMNLS